MQSKIWTDQLSVPVGYLCLQRSGTDFYVYHVQTPLISTKSWCLCSSSTDREFAHSYKTTPCPSDSLQKKKLIPHTSPLTALADYFGSFFYTEFGSGEDLGSNSPLMKFYTNKTPLLTHSLTVTAYRHITGNNQIWDSANKFCQISSIHHIFGCSIQFMFKSFQVLSDIFQLPSRVGDNFWCELSALGNFLHPI